jgi:hypothetical protein
MDPNNCGPRCGPHPAVWYSWWMPDTWVPYALLRPMADHGGRQNAGATSRAVGDVIPVLRLTVLRARKYIGAQKSTVIDRHYQRYGAIVITAAEDLQNRQGSAQNLMVVYGRIWPQLLIVCEVTLLMTTATGKVTH